MTPTNPESPAERIARWTSTDAAIGAAAENEQLRASLAQRTREIDDMRARLAQLSTRVAQLEADNADLRRAASRMPVRTLVEKVYRRARSAAARRVRR